MPPQKGMSSLVSALGEKGRKAWEEVRGKETTYGQMELPAGIENGMAQLNECKFDRVAEGKENAGKYYFYASAIVLSPDNHDGTPVKGMRTSIMEPLYDTPSRTRKTVQDHLDWVRNELQKLGADTTSLGLDQLEDTAAALKSIRPVIRFRTWKGQKQETGAYAGQEPRVQHQWNGVVVDYNPEDHVNGAVQDDTADATVDVASEDATTTNEDTAADSTAGDTVDLATLIASATEGDEDAMGQLTTLAREKGITDAQIEAAQSWEEIGELINASGSGADESAAEPEAEWQPKKGEIYLYKPIDPKTKKPFIDPKTKKERKAVDVEVVAVDPKKKTVDLKNYDDKKTVYKAIPWDKLESA